MITQTAELKSIEKIAKAMGDKNRLSILMHITENGGWAQCADIHGIIDLTQPSISHHVKILVEAGLIEPEKEGRNFKYTLNISALETFCKFLSRLKNQ
jgi:ArsR family transcriptional regulator